MVMTFSDLTKKVGQSLKKKLSLITRITSATYFRYDDISLKLYIEIAQTGKFRKLLRSGTFDHEECLTRWELIVKEHQEMTGNTQYNELFYLQQGYHQLLAQHAIVRALLLTMRLDPDEATFNELNKRGYRLILTTRPAYLMSYKIAEARCKNIVTKATMKLKELERAQEVTEKVKGKSFDAIMVELNMAIAPDHASDDISLSRYNEYVRLIKERNKIAARKNNGRV